MTLDECNIRNGNVINILLWFRGGGKPPIEEVIKNKKTGAEIYYLSYVNIQNCDGSWDERVLDLCDKTKDEVIKSMPVIIKRIPEKVEQLKVMFTWIGINRLRSLFILYQECWKLAVKKAENFLVNKTPYNKTSRYISCDLFD